MWNADSFHTFVFYFIGRNSAGIPYEIKNSQINLFTVKEITVKINMLNETKRTGDREWQKNTTDGHRKMSESNSG